MKKQKPLIETNPHLKNLKRYGKALVLNVASSTAVETDASVKAVVRMLTNKAKAKSTKKSKGSGR